MRIMHCVWRMGLGGAERQLVQLSRALIRRGHSVSVVSRFAGELDAEVSRVGATQERVFALHKYDVRVVPQLASLIRRVNPDVVQTWLTQMDIVGGVAAKWADFPWILSERSSAAAYPTSAIHFSRRLMGARAAAIAANSEGGSEYWRRFVDASRVRLIPNIVPQDEIDAIAALRDRQETVLYVGRLNPEKNVETLIHALAVVFAQRNAVAVLCGDGPNRSSLIELARNLGIAERITFAGSVSNVWERMKQASVSVSLSFFEGSPNVILESVAAGLPVVCSDIKAHREIVDEESATIVKGWHPDAVAAGILESLGNREQALTRAALARSRLVSRSADAVAAQYEALYRDVIGRRN